MKAENVDVIHDFVNEEKCTHNVVLFAKMISMVLKFWFDSFWLKNINPNFVDFTVVSQIPYSLFCFTAGLLGKLFCVQYICISVHNSSIRIFKIRSISQMGFIKLPADGFIYCANCLYNLPSNFTRKVRTCIN